MYALTEQLEELLGPPSGNGLNVSYLCPFHEEDTPSLSINQENGMWKCWGCNESGGIRKLYQLLGKELDSDYVFQSLIKSVDRKPKRKPNFAPLANQLIANLAGRDGQSHLQHYTDVRPVNRSFADHFAIGFKPERTDEKGKQHYAALAFPYWDATGRVTGIKYRSWNGHKYSEDDSYYGLYNGADAIGRRNIFITEGESDCHAAWSLIGDKDMGVVGTSGASIDGAGWNRLSLGLIGARRIYLCYDADDAGDKCANTAIRVLGSERCVRIRPRLGKDLSDHLNNGGTLDQLDGLEEEDRNLFRASGTRKNVVHAVHASA